MSDRRTHASQMPTLSSEAPPPAESVSGESGPEEARPATEAEEASVVARIEHWRTLSRETERLIEASRPLARSGLDTSPEKLREVSDRLKRLRLSEPTLATEADSLAELLSTTADELEATARASLLDGLRAAADAASLPFRRLSDNPLEVSIGPLDVSLPERGPADIRLGREVIGTAPQEPHAIVDACTREMKALKDALIPSEPFFALLHRAWRMVLAARDPSPDGRADLVDLLLPLALLELGPDRWRAARAERGVTPWPRVRLAYQLYRLRRDKALEQRGLRVELAAATLSTTRDNRNVLHVLSGDGRGQFYGAIRFVGHAGHDAPPPQNADAPANNVAPKDDTSSGGTSADADDALGGVLDLFGPDSSAEK